MFAHQEPELTNYYCVYSWGNWLGADIALASF
jgi:hypothetical protein